MKGIYFLKPITAAATQTEQNRLQKIDNNEISLFREKLHLINVITFYENNVYNEKNSYDLIDWSRVQIRVETVLNRLFDFLNKMTIDYQCKSLFFINIILLFNFLK